MKPRRNTNLLVEPPSVATGDIAFNLIVFFLVCASSQPDSGRQQQLPRSDDSKKSEQKVENITVKLTRNTAILNGDPLTIKDFGPKLQRLLADKKRPEDRVVVMTSTPDVPYHFWIDVSVAIDQAGGLVTIQREEERTVSVPN
jgi:biopolymer transport protein ExbD